MIPWTFQKLNLLLDIFIFYYRYISDIEIIYNLGKKSFVLTVLLECKMEKRNSQWGKQEACFARATRVWFAGNHNTSITSCEWIQCSKCLVHATELGSCQSNMCNSWDYEGLQKSKDSLKADALYQ